MTHLIGIAGQMNSGKGAVSELLQSQRGYLDFAFGDHIKHLAKDLFDLPDEELWGASQRRTPRVRRILQALGTEFGREFDMDVWVRKFKQRFLMWRETGTDILGLIPDGDAHAPIVVSDVRFPNEAACIARELHGQVIRVYRHDNYVHVEDSIRQHASEVSVSKIPSDLICATAINDGTLNALHARIFNILGELYNEPR